MVRGHNNPYSRTLFLSPVSPKTTGGSLDLANGQLALVNTDESTSRGSAVVADINTVNSKARLAIMVGTGRRSDAGQQSNKNFSTHLFKKGDILDVTYSSALAPTYSDITLGYNGVAGTGIALQEKQATTVSLTLSGEALSYLGFQNGEAHMLFNIFAGNPEDCDSCATPCSTTSCKSITTDLVERIREHKLRAGSFANTGAAFKVGDLIDVIPTLSCYRAPASVGTSTSYTLTLQDNGTLEALGIVQAQYPSETVERISREDITSVYEIKSASAPSDFQGVTPNELLLDCDCPTGYTESAGGFVYTIEANDNGLHQAAADAIDTYFASSALGVATVTNVGAADASRAAGTYTGIPASGGTGSNAEFDLTVDGSGAVTSITPVAGDEGTGYVIGDTLTIADADIGNGGGAALTFDVATVLPDVTSVQHIGVQSGGVSQFLVVLDGEIYQRAIDEIQTGGVVFADLGEGVVTTLGEADTLCVPDAQPSAVAWVAGEVCTTHSTQVYIDLKDTVCGESRLAELQAAFADLTITIDSDTELTNCRQRYLATVNSTNVVCSDCVDITVEPEFELPSDFEFTSWKFVEPADTAITSYDFEPASGFGATASTASTVTPSGGTGTGFQAEVVTNAAGDGVDYINIVDAGSGYVVGDTLTVDGRDLAGGSTPADDITITVTSVGGDYPDDCECGITFRAKKGFLCPNAVLAESVGVFTPKGVRIQVSGGEAPTNLIEGYKFVTTPFTVTRDGRDFDGTGWGVHYMCEEKAQSEFFLGITPTRNYGEAWLAGFETKLEPCSQYDMVTVLIKRENYAGMNSSRLREDIRYNFVFDSGDVCKYASFFNSLGGEIVCP